MQIDIAPETERLVREELERGHFRSVDEMIRAGVESRRERGQEGPAEKPRKHITEVIVEMMKDVPPEVWDAMPKDGASEHDHYLYGTPKKNQ